VSAADLADLARGKPNHYDWTVDLIYLDYNSTVDHLSRHQHAGRIPMTGSTITIRTDPEIAEKITALAKAMDRSRNWVIEEALKQYIETQTWQIEGIKEGIASLDRGEGIPHDEVMAKIRAKLEAKLGKPEQ
jgi:predicted transcriptional regulator